MLAPQMAHAYAKPWLDEAPFLAPLHLHRGPLGLQGLDGAPEALPLRIGERDHRGPGELQPRLPIAGEDRDRRLVAALDRDDDELPLAGRLRLEPALRIAGAVAAPLSLGDDPLEPHRFDSPEEVGAASLDMGAELDREAGIVRSDQLFEPGPPLLHRSRAQVAPAQVDEVERHQHQPLRRPCDRPLKRVEVGPPLGVLDDHLPVDQRLADSERRRRLDQRPVFRCPVVPGPAERPRLSAGDRDLRPEPVIFELVQPFVAVGRRIDERRKHRSKESVHGPGTCQLRRGALSCSSAASAAASRAYRSGWKATSPLSGTAVR